MTTLLRSGDRQADKDYWLTHFSIRREVVEGVLFFHMLTCELLLLTESDCPGIRQERPFAWLYQLGHWARRGIESGVTINALSKASSAAKEETEFLQKLGVTKL